MNLVHWKIPALYEVQFTTHKDGSLALFFQAGREEEVATHIAHAIDAYRMRGAQVPPLPAWVPLSERTGPEPSDVDHDSNPDEMR